VQLETNLLSCWKEGAYLLLLLFLLLFVLLISVLLAPLPLLVLGPPLLLMLARTLEGLGLRRRKRRSAKADDAADVAASVGQRSWPPMVQLQLAGLAAGRPQRSKMKRKKPHAWGLPYWAACQHCSR